MARAAMAVAANTANQWPPRPQRCSNGGGPKFKLLHEGDIQVCRLNHSRTLISKVLSSKFLRRWEAHHVYLGDFQLYSATYAGFMNSPVAYQEIQDVYTVNRWDTGQHFCIRITIPDGSVLLRASNAYLRDQWLHSLKWKVNLQRYKKLLTKTYEPDALTRELKELVLFSLTTPLQDDVIFTVPLKIVSEILGNNHHEVCCDNAQERLIVALAPVLEYVQPSPEVCSFFSQHCKGQSHFTDVMDMFEAAIHRILKHNMDFGKFPHLRMFVQDYIFTLYCKNESAKDVRDFVISMHSPGAACPHPRVLPNLVAVVLASVYSTFDQPNILVQYEDFDVRFLLCFMTVLDTCAQYEDWRPSLATLLQPIPFPKQALKNETFILYISGVIKLFAEDLRCEVHQTILPIRKGKDGWMDIFCPGGVSCFDEGHFFSLIMTQFLNCCGRRKKMLTELKETMMGPFMLLALRGDSAFIQTLTFMLEIDLLDDEDEKLQIVSTLESTEEGIEIYEHLCQKREKFREMIEKGGPTVLTLPTKSTDDDLARLLGSGSFGNVRSLNLAFTHVTSACAEHLVQLPALVHLNLWSTQFGDVGLQVVAEHLHNLESLNLCETPVTDAGLSSLIVMTSLRVLNLNSTKLSPAMFERLKKLPQLEDIDVRYTDV